MSVNQAEIIEALEKTKSLILKRENWCQRSLINEHGDPKDHQYCLYGALRMACFGRVRVSLDDNRDRKATAIFFNARMALYRRARELGFQHIEMANDHLFHEAVIKMIDDSVAEARNTDAEDAKG